MVWVFDLRSGYSHAHFNATLEGILNHENISIIGHNIKFDMHWAGIPIGSYPKAQFIDTAVGSFLLDENIPHGLKSLTKRVFGVTLREFKDVLGKKTIRIPDKRTKKGTRKKTIPRLLSEVPSGEVAQYVAEDAYWTERLWFESVKPKLEAQPNLYRNFLEIQVPLTKVLWAIERRGVQVNVKAAEKLERQYTQEANDIERRILSGLQSLRLEYVPLLSSPQQVDELLYKTLGFNRPPFRSKRKDATGQKVQSKYQTDELSLIWLAQDQGHKIAKNILKLRKLRKTCGTFLNAIINHSVNGRLHTNYNQTGARTGRLSSSKPCNLQNIPRDKAIRRLFIAKPGTKLLRADLSQAELRFLAHFSQDPMLLKAFMDSTTDLHSDTANAVGLINLLGYEDGRFAGKTANFSVVYGVWADTFRAMLYKETDGRINLSHDEATRVVEGVKNDRFRGLAPWEKRTLQSLHATGWVHTIEHRKRRLPNVHSQNWGIKSYAERQGINAIVQGSVGDCINRIMADLIYDICLKYAVLQVHDELVFEAQDVPAIAAEIKKIPGRVVDYYKLTVPLVMEYNIGEVWSK